MHLHALAITRYKKIAAQLKNPSIPLQNNTKPRKILKNLSSREWSRLSKFTITAVQFWRDKRNSYHRSKWRCWSKKGKKGKFKEDYQPEQKEAEDTEAKKEISEGEKEEEGDTKDEDIKEELLIVTPSRKGK